MPHENTHGPAGGPRPLAQCDLSLVFQIEESIEEEIQDPDQLIDEIEQKITVGSPGVSIRGAKFEGLSEIVVKDGSGIIMGPENRQYERAVQSTVLDELTLIDKYYST